MNTNYQIIKLSNGENIICDIKDQNKSDIILEVTAPLKMDIMSRVTEAGIEEGLALTRWVQPFTDEKDIPINKATIVTMVPASLGMSKYYEYILQNIRKMKLVTSTTEDIEEPSSEELSQIQLEEGIEENLNAWNRQDELERLLEETSEFLKKHNRTIH
jgi:hypothetical protein|tara:strand:- start:382 stop:858 length:477 start_codon:yes stop_codon:yes gene_type:complete